MKKKGGMALLLMLVCMSVCSLLSLHYWFITGLHYDIVRQRELFYRHVNDTEQMLDHGLAIVSQQFDFFYSRIKKEKRSLRLHLGKKQQENMHVTLQLDPGGRGIVVCAQKIEQEHVCFQVRCLLKRQKKGKRVQCVVECFTLGSGL